MNVDFVLVPRQRWYGKDKLADSHLTIVIKITVGEIKGYVMREKEREIDRDRETDTDRQRERG